MTAHSPRNGLAATLMLTAVLLASTSPAAAYITSAHDHPLIFNATLRLGMAGGFLALTIALYGTLPLNVAREFIRRPSALVHWGPAAAMFGTTDYLFYALATQRIGPAAAVPLMETWPALVIIVGALATRGSRRYTTQPLRAALAAAAAITGVALVIASQDGSLSSLLPGNTAANTLLGAALALGAALTLAPVTIAIRWCEEMAAAPVHSAPRNPIVYIGLLNAAVSLASSAAYAAGAAAAHETAPAQAIAIPLLCGLLTQAAGAMAWRVANHLTDRLNLNLILFGLPAAAQAWIFLLGGLTTARPGYLLLGTALIIAANTAAAVIPTQRTRPKT